MNNFGKITRLLFLLVIQIIILNNVNFLGYINPMIYLLFFIDYPRVKENFYILFLAFLSGLLLDIFSDTSGVYAASTVAMVYLRPIAIRFFLGENLEYDRPIYLLQISLYNRFSYIFLLAFVFHFFFFFLESFNIFFFEEILKKTLFTAFFTTLLCKLFIYFKNEKK